jgi:hypothetical protein
MLDGSDEEWDEHESDEETSWSGLRQQRELGPDGRLVVHFDVSTLPSDITRAKKPGPVPQAQGAKVDQDTKLKYHLV